MTQPQAYRLRKSSTLNPDATEGCIVYASSGYDYGLASDDTRMTGVEHISVTLKRSGGYPTVTIPLHDLEKTTAPPLERLTGQHVTDICRPGEGTATCRYLTMSAKGWSCRKHTLLADTLDSRVIAETIIARGDNCEGRDA